MLVGLVGYGQSGKDTVGKVLIDKGWQRIAFADTLREALYVLNPYIGPNKLQEMVDNMGWDTAKGFPEVRRLLQVLGTEVGREMFGKDFWVDLAFNNKVIPVMNDGTHVVITDVRFPNEIRRVRECGGSIWRVVRPHVGPLNSHASEAAWTKVKEDYRIINDGTLDELKSKVETGLQTCLMI